MTLRTRRVAFTMSFVALAITAVCFAAAPMAITYAGLLLSAGVTGMLFAVS